MKQISLAVILAFLAQLVPASALASCSNDHYYNDGRKSCITHCQCGTAPETCGCCSTNCTYHDDGSPPSGSGSSGGSSSSDGPRNPLVMLLYAAILGGIIYWIWRDTKKSESSSSQADVRTGFGMGFRLGF